MVTRPDDVLDLIRRAITESADGKAERRSETEAADAV
jgi:hypothetical protein